MAWFLACSALFLTIAVVSLSGPMRPRPLEGGARFLQACSTLLFVLAMVLTLMVLSTVLRPLTRTASCARCFSSAMSAATEVAEGTAAATAG